MRRRDFGQYCGLARALELVGERWALLIVRDLLVHPRRYTDLLEGLPGIPTNVLSTRLKEFEGAGLVERRIAPAPQRGVVYALTDDGRTLEPVVLSLGQWGASRLGDPQPGDIVTPEMFAMSLRAAFNKQEAADVTASWEIHGADLVVYATVADGALETGIGPVPGRADLVITFASDALPSYISLLQAIKCGLVELEGGRELMDAFTRIFSRPNAA